ncbi:tRNA wybutosine-synthesizing protein 3 homolog [Engraulis encrasicolus]|uniref:tRNA wybutosine-synthesizing protein 3 homolog n=1 Tax=Engraulis encrasicolus TaxID=184585 RepID=UPI002FD11BF0
MQPEEMENTFSQCKSLHLSRVDLSRKGSIDDDIYPVVSLLNNSPNYFTTSSCSGRVIVIDGLSETSEIQKQNCSWLFVTHQKCSEEDVISGLRNSRGSAVFKFEPFVLHVQCKDITSARLLLSVAVQSGFRNSGVSIGKRDKIILAVRSTHCLEVPLSHTGEIMVNEKYIHFLVQAANQKMTENLHRIKRFYAGVQAALQSDESSCTTNLNHPSKKRHCKQASEKKQDSMIEQNRFPSNKLGDPEDYFEDGLALFS